MRWRDLVLTSDGPVTSAQRLVAVALAKHMHRDGSGAFPSGRLLAEETRLARNTVMKALDGLTTDAWIENVGTGRRGRFGVPISEYRARLPDKLIGATTEPLDGSGNGAAMAQQWLNSDPPMAQPLSLNSLTTNSDEKAPVPPRSQSGAAAGVQSRFERIVEDQIKRGYDRAAAEQIANASIVVAREAKRKAS